MFIVADLVSLNVREGTESRYPSIVFLSILYLILTNYYQKVCNILGCNVVNLLGIVTGESM